MQSYRLITVATLVDRLKINGSLARQALKDLEDKGQIKKVVGHSKLSIYSMCLLFPLVYLRWVGGREGSGESAGRGNKKYLWQGMSILWREEIGIFVCG